MSTHRPIGAMLLSLAALHVASQPAFAQSQRPYRGLFGTTGDVAAHHELVINVGAAEAYDDNLLGESGGATATGPAVSGFYSRLLADATYNWRGRRAQFGASGGTAYRYYNEQDASDVSYTTGVGFSFDLARRTRLSANQTIAYSPSYLFGLFPSLSTPVPGDSIPVAPDYAVNNSASYSYGTTASLSHGLTRRGTLAASFDYQKTDFVEEIQDRRDLSSYGARVQFARGLSRDVSLRLGYRYRTGNFNYAIADAGATTEHGAEFGIDYVQNLSATRKMTFSFSLGPAATNAPALPTLGIDSGQQYDVRGDFSFGYQFGRTWEARASYLRALQYVPELVRPVDTDGVSATINGMLTPRMDLIVAAGYTSGTPSSGRGGSSFDTYTVSAKVRQALARQFSLDVEYLYYFYDFGLVQLPLGVPSAMERNGVRVGLTVFLTPYRR